MTTPCAPTFYLGTHHPGWLTHQPVPLCVSYRQLRRYRTPPSSTTTWILDSGAYMELTRHHRWTIHFDEYADAAAALAADPNLHWFAPQDWPCEPSVRAATGGTVDDHQHLSTESFASLRTSPGGAKAIPVLQGWTLDDYERHLDVYAAAGFDLWREPVVGLGSVCRRGSVRTIVAIIEHLGLHGLGLRLHGFGVKTTGLRCAGEHLVSADSLAWSYAARYDPPLPGCTHQHCQNCPRYAAKWGSAVSATFAAAWHAAEREPRQLSLAASMPRHATTPLPSGAWASCSLAAAGGEGTIGPRTRRDLPVPGGVAVTEVDERMSNRWSLVP